MAITVYLGSTQVGYGASNKYTSGNLSRWIDLDWGALTRTQFGHPKPYGHGKVRTGEAWADSRILTGVLWTQYAASSAERNILDEVNDDLPQLFNPSTDTWDLRVDRTDSGGGSTSRILTVETVEIPDLFTGRIHWEDASYGWAAWPFTLEAAFPFWRDRTATSEAVACANATATTAAGSWTTIANGGFERAGMKFVISAITGTITSVVITNTTHSVAATWSDGTALANSDEIDFGVDDPMVTNWTAGNRLNATGDMYIERGNNDGTFAVTGSGNPACTITLSYRKYWKGF